MKFLPLIAALSLLSFGVNAQELPPVGETDMSHSHELLGTIDDCRVWKINYWGDYVFVTRCPGTGSQISQTQWEKSCGENCVENVFVSTKND